MAQVIETGACTCEVEPGGVDSLSGFRQGLRYKYELCKTRKSEAPYYRVYIDNVAMGCEPNAFDIYFAKTGDLLLSAEKELERLMSNPDFVTWYKYRPKAIQNLVAKYPHPWYVMKAGAPYGIACPGAIVRAHGYHEDGTMTVIVFAKDKLPAAIEHEKMLCNKHNKDPEEIHGKDVAVVIDPQWMEPYFKISE